MAEPHLCLVNSLRQWGGAEVWFLETALGLLERGHRVSVVAQPDSELARRCKSRGVPCQGIAIRFDAAPWTLAKLSRYFRRQGVTAVLTNLTKDLKAAAVAARLAGVGTVLASRESDFPLKSKPYYRWYFRELSSGLLVNSRATGRTVLESAPWLDEQKVHLLYKGIDLERFKPGSRVLEPVVGFAGQLIERKGLSALMKAWEELTRNPELGQAQLKVAGDGPLMNDLQQWRQTLARPEKVHILGAIDSMPGFHRSLRVLAMPSLSEGFGLVAAEALACGVPVVASNTSSLPEIVLPGKTGHLVPVGDARALAHSLATLLLDDERTHTLGVAGRAHVVQNFNREDTLDRLAELTGLKAPKN